MSRKIPVHELAASLASTCDISPEYAEEFIRRFFELVAEGVIAGEIVRVKGIGTFAASGDAANPVEFTPDRNLANAVNAPFAIFEPEPVDASVSDEELDNIVVEVPAEPGPAVETEGETVVETSPETEVKAESPVTPEATVSEPEAPAAVSEDIPVTEAVQVEIPAEGEKPQIKSVKETKVSQEPGQAVQTVVAETTESSTETASPRVMPDESTVVPPPHPDLASAPKIVDSPVVTPPAFDVEEDMEEHVGENIGSDSGSGFGFGWGLAIGLIVGLALGACGVYFGINYLYPMPSRESIEAVENNEESVVEETVPAVVPNDSIASAVETPDTIVPAVVKSDTVAKAAPEVTPAPAQAVVKDKIKAGYLLHEMARKHYGNKAFWVYIYEENKAKIGNPNRVGQGLELVIPPADKYGINPNDPASLKAAKDLAGQILSKYPN